MWARLVLQHVLEGLATHPVAWFLALSTGLVWRAFERLLPLGLTTQSLHRSAAHYEIAFIAGALTIVLVVTKLLRLENILRPAPPVRRTATELLALMIAAGAIGAFAVLPATLLGSWQFARFDVVASLAALLLAWAHVSAFCLFGTTVLARSSTTDPGALAWVALLATLLLPGLIPGGGYLQNGLLLLLDAGAPVRASFETSGLGAHHARALLPISALVALRISLVAPAPTPASATPHDSHSAHALRDPR